MHNWLINEATEACFQDRQQQSYTVVSAWWCCIRNCAHTVAATFAVFSLSRPETLVPPHLSNRDPSYFLVSGSSYYSVTLRI